MVCAGDAVNLHLFPAPGHSRGTGLRRPWACSTRPPGAGCGSGLPCSDSSPSSCGGYLGAGGLASPGGRRMRFCRRCWRASMRLMGNGSSSALGTSADGARHLGRWRRCRRRAVMYGARRGGAHAAGPVPKRGCVGAAADGERRVPVARAAAVRTAPPWNTGTRPGWGVCSLLRDRLLGRVCRGVCVQ